MNKHATITYSCTCQEWSLQTGIQLCTLWSATVGRRNLPQHTTLKSNLNYYKETNKWLPADQFPLVHSRKDSASIPHKSLILEFKLHKCQEIVILCIHPPWTGSLNPWSQPLWIQQASLSLAHSCQNGNTWSMNPSKNMANLCPRTTCRCMN